MHPGTRHRDASNGDRLCAESVGRGALRALGQTDQGGGLVSRYATTHRAMTETARAHGLRASDVWLLAAVVDEGGMTTTDVLERAMHVEGTAIRRSLIVLRPRYLVGGNVTGRRVPIQITTEGVGVIGDMLRLELELEGDGR